MQGIYAIRHIATGRTYVGSTIRLARRWKEHQTRLNNGSHPACHLLRAWRAYGADSFEFVILEKCDVSAESVRIERENYWMRLLLPVFNSAPVAGSILGMKRSEESRARMSAAQKARYAAKPTTLKGRPRTPEARAAIGAGGKGRIFTAQHIANLGASLKGRISPRKGVKLSDETKAKISASKTGSSQSPEAIARRVASRARNRKFDTQKQEGVVLLPQ